MRSVSWLVLCAACATAPPPPIGPALTTDEVAQVRERAERHATGRLTGRIDRVDSSSLVLVPFDERTRTWQLKFARDAAVFSGNDRRGVDVLHEGDAVRVFYENRSSDGTSRITAVEPLTDEEARALRNGLIPPRNSDDP